MSFQVILQGIVTGLVLSVYVGATFFTVMETSLRRGPIAAVLLNAGVWISDTAFIVIAFYGATELMDPIKNSMIIRILAGVLFMIFGLAYFFRKPKETVKRLAGKGILILLGKGFAINTLNPSVILFWFGAMVVAVTNFNFSGLQITYYFASTLLTVMAIDMLKILFATQLRRFINDRLMIQLFRVTGVILIIFGLFVMISSIGH